MKDYLIRTAQYRGRGTVSWVIKKQTDSIWSHSAAISMRNSVYESWLIGGVSHVKETRDNFYDYDLIACLSKNHKAGTLVDIFGIEATLEQAQAYELFLQSQVGELYDVGAIFRFLTRKSYEDNDRWFCSEYVSHGLKLVDIYLQCRIRSYQMSPKLVGISPLHIPIQTVVTI